MKTLLRITVCCLFALGLASVVFIGGCGEADSRPADSRPVAIGDPTDAEAGFQFVEEAEPISGVSQSPVGEGLKGAVILSAEGRAPSRDAVVFLHGWAAWPPDAYAGWMRHLIQRGNTVIYPVIQGVKTLPEALRVNALAGIEAGLREIDADPDAVVAVGNTTGGALALDYAAAAKSSGLPVPRAVMAVYPGRNPGYGIVTPADLSRIPAETWLAVVDGPGNFVPEGEAQAREALSAATRVPRAQRSYLIAPRGTKLEGTDPASRRAFWAPFDRLIAKARADSE